MPTAPNDRNARLAEIMRDGNDRPTACIILDAREAAATRLASVTPIRRSDRELEPGGETLDEYRRRVV